MKLESKPEVFISVPPPVYEKDLYTFNQSVINELYPKLIPEIAEKAGLNPLVNVIDIFNALGG